jgi:hypothetical protein
MITAQLTDLAHVSSNPSTTGQRVYSVIVIMPVFMAFSVSSRVDL